VVSSLPTLVAAYGGRAGVYFVAQNEAKDFLAAMMDIRRAMRADAIEPATIAAQIESRAQSSAVPELLDALARLDD
jgi:hypothetical protein